MTTTIYSMGYDRFGPEQKGDGQRKRGVNRRISKFCGELRGLSKDYRRAPEEGRTPLEQLRALHRPENLGKKRKEQMRKRAQFISHPFQFASFFYDTRDLVGYCVQRKRWRNI